MSDAEGKVRKVWKIGEFDLECSHGGSWQFKDGHPLNCLGWFGWTDRESDALGKLWSAALAFTEQRLREIAEVEEEIEILNSEIEEPDDNWKDPSRAVEAFLRILDREQAALAELKRGMKGEATQ